MQMLGQEQLENDEVLIMLKSISLFFSETEKSFDSERKSSSWNTKEIASERVSYPLSGWTTKRTLLFTEVHFSSRFFSGGRGYWSPQ